MLVLTRKSQETIRIGDNITVSVLRVKGRAVRIGIEAPDKVRVIRGELGAPKEDARPQTEAEATSTEIASTEGQLQEDSATSFETPAKISTQSVNRILASRRNGRRSSAPLANAFRTATRSRAWDKVRHVSIG